MLVQINPGRIYVTVARWRSTVSQQSIQIDISVHYLLMEYPDAVAFSSRFWSKICSVSIIGIKLIEILINCIYFRNLTLACYLPVFLCLCIYRFVSISVLQIHANAITCVQVLLFY